MTRDIRVPCACVIETSRGQTRRRWLAFSKAYSIHFGRPFFRHQSKDVVSSPSFTVRGLRRMGTR